ncbi:hypothetical protein NDU88_003119 [Pleurodeles waltl]|uniref:Uncharacterized protein n=1 Tax=Pleurodeles waltl TaxID=8319 RepID=A0AAV7V1I1_PLEWA|nr:hypothetical protein NDU88_003119 [Pleurodeles waltl]
MPPASTRRVRNPWITRPSPAYQSLNPSMNLFTSVAVQYSYEYAKDLFYWWGVTPRVCGREGGVPCEHGVPAPADMPAAHAHRSPQRMLTEARKRTSRDFKARGKEQSDQGNKKQQHCRGRKEDIPSKGGVKGKVAERSCSEVGEGATLRVRAKCGADGGRKERQTVGRKEGKSGVGGGRAALTVGEERAALTVGGGKSGRRWGEERAADGGARKERRGRWGEERAALTVGGGKSGADGGGWKERRGRWGEERAARTVGGGKSGADGGGRKERRGRWGEERAARTVGGGKSGADGGGRKERRGRWGEERAARTVGGGKSGADGGGRKERR